MKEYRLHILALVMILFFAGCTDNESHPPKGEMITTNTVIPWHGKIEKLSGETISTVEIEEVAPQESPKQNSVGKTLIDDVKR